MFRDGVEMLMFKGPFTTLDAAEDAYIKACSITCILLLSILIQNSSLASKVRFHDTLCRVLELLRAEGRYHEAWRY